MESQGKNGTNVTNFDKNNIIPFLTIVRFIENLERREVKRAVIAFGNAFLRLFDAHYISPIIGTVLALDLGRLFFIQLFSRALT